MDPLKQAEIVVAQYRQWLADSQLENANLRATNQILTERVDELTAKEDPNA